MIYDWFICFAPYLGIFLAVLSLLLVGISIVVRNLKHDFHIFMKGEAFKNVDLIEEKLVRRDIVRNQETQTNLYVLEKRIVDLEAMLGHHEDMLVKKALFDSKRSELEKVYLESLAKLFAETYTVEKETAEKEESEVV